MTDIVEHDEIIHVVLTSKNAHEAKANLARLIIERQESVVGLSGHLELPLIQQEMGKAVRGYKTSQNFEVFVQNFLKGFFDDEISAEEGIGLWIEDHVLKKITADHWQHLDDDELVEKITDLFHEALAKFKTDHVTIVVGQRISRD